VGAVQWGIQGGLFMKIRKPLPKNARSQPVIDPALWMILIYLGIFVSLYLLVPQIISPIAFGWFIALIIDVPARFISQWRHLSYKVSVILSSLFIYGLLLFAFFLLIPIAVDQAQKVAGFLSGYVVEIQQPAFFDQFNLNSQVLDMIESSAGSLVKMITDFGVKILNSVIQNLPSILTGSVLFLITASYFSTLTPVIRDNIWRLFPRSSLHRSLRFWKDFYKDIQHFVAGQMLIALFTGLFVGIGMLVLGIPYPLFLGFLAGITNFIPYLGSIITMIPAILLGLTDQGFWGAVKGVGVLLLVNQMEAWIMRPFIQGNMMKLNWFVILLSIFVFGSFFGVLGILFSIPIVVFIRRFWVTYVQEALQRM